MTVALLGISEFKCCHHGVPFHKRQGFCSKVSVAPVPTMKLLLLQLRVPPRGSGKIQATSFPTKGIAKPKQDGISIGSLVEYGLCCLLPIKIQLPCKMDTNKKNIKTDITFYFLHLCAIIGPLQHVRFILWFCFVSIAAWRCLCNAIAISCIPQRKTDA